MTTNYGFWVHPKGYMGPVFVSYSSKEEAEQKVKEKLSYGAKVGPIREIECDMPQPKEHVLHFFFYAVKDYPNTTFTFTNSNLDMVKHQYQDRKDRLWDDILWVGKIHTIKEVQE